MRFYCVPDYQIFNYLHQRICDTRSPDYPITDYPLFKLMHHLIQTTLTKQHIGNYQCNQDVKTLRNYEGVQRLFIT